MDHNAGAVPREGGDDLHRDRHETENALRDAYAHLSAGQTDAEIEIAEPLAHLPPETGQNAALVGKNVKIVFIQPDNGAAVVGKGELAELFAARRGEDRVHIVPKAEAPPLPMRNAASSSKRRIPAGIAIAHARAPRFAGFCFMPSCLLSDGYRHAFFSLTHPGEKSNCILPERNI